jgi:hypothetical protein
MHISRDTLPVVEFKVTSDTTKMENFDVVVMTFKPLSASIAQYIGTKVWVLRIVNDQVTEKYLGELETERGIYRPLPQPLKDAYIIVECSEYDGQVTIITKDGDFQTIPGYYYALNKSGHIYTRQANLNSLVYHYDLKNRKGTDLSYKNVTMDNLLFEEVEGTYWVK